MKKLILTVLMIVMISTPCLAEIQPDGVFLIEGTRWEFESEENYATYFGFHEGKVYILPGGICIELKSSSYNDFIIFSLFEYEVDAWSDGDPDSVKCIGILFPLLEIGYAVEYDTRVDKEYSQEYYLKKAGDNWQPESICIVF